MHKLLREPLRHFLLLGAGIFLVYSLMSHSDSSGESGKIVVTLGQVEHLAAGFARAWQRPPTAQELAGLVRDRGREEVYVREALALGLDKDDTIIRRRLRQKMEFIADDIAQADPTDAALNASLQAHPDAFRVEQRLTFRQVYLNPEKHGEHLARDAAQLLAQLNQSGATVDASALGDPFLLEHQFVAVPASEVADVLAWHVSRSGGQAQMVVGLSRPVR